MSRNPPIPLPSPSYEYRAKVTAVYDGDTFTVDIDLGLGVWMHGQKIRLYGVDTPEVRGKERARGIQVRDHVRDLILGNEVLLETHRDKKGKYGRWLARVLVNKNGGNLDLSQHLLDRNLAVEMLY